MYDYYIKIKEGFEYCKTNLESELSFPQFESTVKLCNNYIKLCEHYKKLVKKEYTKRDYKYLSNIVDHNNTVLAGMVSTWMSQYNDDLEEDERNDNKMKDAFNALLVQDDYNRQMVKNRTVVKGFLSYMPKKKKGRKKNPNKSN